MMRRNDGYTLAYVVVVLGVMAAVALATMTLALMPQKSQHASLERMKDKYAAQGMVEIIVAQLEHADAEKLPDVLDAYKYDESNQEQKMYCTQDTTSTPVKYTIVASADQTVLTAEFTLEERTKSETTGEGEDAVTTTTTIGHTVNYISYKMEVAES